VEKGPWSAPRVLIAAINRLLGRITLAFVFLSFDDSPFTDLKRRRENGAEDSTK